jgi:phosphosulfolactate phosphohydrolase-like enzyme
MMLERGLAHEIAYAAQLSKHAVVPRLEAGRLVLA